MGDLNICSGQLIGEPENYSEIQLRLKFDQQGVHWWIYTHFKCWNTYMLQSLSKYLAMMKTMFDAQEQIREWEWGSHLSPPRFQQEFKGQSTEHSRWLADRKDSSSPGSLQCHSMSKQLYIQKHSRASHWVSARSSLVCRTSKAQYPGNLKMWKLEQKKRHSVIVPVAWFSF